MGTATSPVPIGWTRPADAPRGSVFMDLFHEATNHVSPVCTVLVDKSQSSPSFMVLGWSLGASLMPTAGTLYQMQLFAYPNSRTEFVGRLRASGFVDLISAGGC